MLAEPPQWIPKTAVRGRLSERFFGNTVAHGSAHVNGEAALYTVHEKEKKQKKREVYINSRQTVPYTPVVDNKSDIVRLFEQKTQGTARRRLSKRK